MPTDVARATSQIAVAVRAESDASRSNESGQATAGAADKLTPVPDEAVQSSGSGLAPAASANEPARIASAPSGQSTEATARAVAAQLADQVADQARGLRPGKSTEVRLRLRPDSLGQLDIRLSAGHDGLVVRLMVENPRTQALVERTLGELKAAIQDRGFDASRLVVTVGQGATQFESSAHQQRQPSELVWQPAREESEQPTAIRPDVRLDSASERHSWRLVDYQA